MQLWQKLRQTAVADLIRQTDISAEEKALRLQFLTQMLLLIFPFLVLIQLTRLIFAEPNTTRTAFSFIFSIVAVAAIYIAAKTENYYMVISLIFIIGVAIVISVAITAQQPHIEILYLLLLPLFASMVLSTQETVVWTLLVDIILFAFLLAFVRQSSSDIFTDLIQIAIVFSLLILFAGRQRNRLEKDRQLLAVAREKNEHLSFLITSISHDFRTPLSIINTSSFLIKQSSSDANLLERADKIIRQTDRITEMIENILTLSRLEFTAEENMDHYDMADMVLIALDSLYTPIHNKQVTVHRKFDESVPQVFANYDDLYRITTNILQNAVHAVGPAGEVTVSVRADATRVILTIQDNGSGISAEDLDSVFDPFFRGSKVRDYETGGAGLGLTIVKKTLERYGGHITITSQINIGTTVKIQFPHRDSPLQPLSSAVTADGNRT